MFSDVDIKNAISNQQISISPSQVTSVTGVGYDLRVGEEGFSWKSKRVINISVEGKITIEPNDTVVIRTLESINLSQNIGATIHSMVSQVVPNGLSHISTTIDPGWQGTLLVSIHNHRSSSVELRFEDSFCTVCFYHTNSPAQITPNSPSSRSDIWDRLLEKAQEERQRLTEEERNKKQNERQEQIRRSRFRRVFVAITTFVGVCISLVVKPEMGAIVATIIAGFIPFFLDFKKDDVTRDMNNT